MHFSLATVLAASAILFPPALAAPLPNNNNNGGSCSTDSAPAINVGVGVGGGVYHPNNSNGVKVKKGDTGTCPSGWTRSLLQVDLCIEVGSKDHKKETYKPQTVNRVAHHSPLPYYYSSTSTNNVHYATHTSAPQQKQQSKQQHSKQQQQQQQQHYEPEDYNEDAEYTPRGGGIKFRPTSTSSEGNREPTHKSKSHSSKSHSSSASSTSSSTASAAATGCPKGQTRGTGSFIDMCLDIDTDPLFVGGGIKIGGNNLGGLGNYFPSASPTPTSSSRGNGNNGNNGNGKNGSKTSSASSSATPSSSTRCGRDQEYDSFLDICIDLDTDPLFLGGGIKIGGHSGPSSSSSSARNGGATPSPRPQNGGNNNSNGLLPQNQNQNNANNGGDDRPSCNGPNDPLAFLDLCVDLGNLLGAKVKLGGSPSDSNSGSPTSSSRNSNATPKNQNNGNQNNGNGPYREGNNRLPLLNNGNNGDRDLNNDRGGNNGNNRPPQNQNKQNGNGDLPPCNGPNDPNALLDLCVQVGDILGASAKVGGSDPSSTSSSRSPGRTAVNLGSRPQSQDDDGNILDLSLGSLNAKIGTGPGSKTSTTTSFSPTATPRHYKQTAPINTFPQRNDDNNDDDTPRRPTKNNQSKDNNDDDTPLLSVSASAKVQLGSPSSTARQADRQTPAPSSKKKGPCPVGQILHLGVCVEAEADVLGVASVSAAATVAA